ncbi:MAG: hypothetical protein Q4F00_08975 [bacterium]|nr:hypothetical protein [bacterium]
MKELCFSEYVKCLQSAIQPPNNETYLVELLLNWIIEKENIKGKNQQPMVLTQSVISEIMNRKIEIPKAIKEACSKEKLLPEAISLCQTKIIPYLDYMRRHDMFACMRQAVNKDAVGIAPVNKDLFLNLLDEKKEADFLGSLLIYVIKRNNRYADPAEYVNHIPLLDEAGYKCPVCGVPLIEYVNGTTLPQYAVVHIYNEKITGAQEELAEIPKPQDMDDFNNMIVLCRSHAKRYLSDVTFDKYKQMREYKKHLKADYALRTENGSQEIENSIRSVIQALRRISNYAKLEALSLEALELDRKILPRNNLLKNLLKSQILQYYKFINEQFHTLERSEPGIFGIIASEVQLKYKKLANAGFSQEDIYEKLAVWLNKHLKKGQSAMCACRLIVAFFIQNCEVFDDSAQQSYLIPE